MDLNKVMLIGNITQDPEVRTTPQGQNVCSFSVATNLTWTDQSGQRQSRAEFHNIVAWRKLADICAQYLQKGKKVYVEGRLQTRSWDGKDGVKRYRTEVVADNMIMLSYGPGQGGGAASARGAGSAVGGKAAAPEAVPTVELDADTKGVGKPVATVAAGKGAAKNETITIEDIPF
ncbi:MAG: single-stranded DNA-binding protein [Parcubacteria group bacterium]